jgi:hypothetical protein
MNRIAIGKSARFEVFDRDKFTCQYCGRCPPEVQLVIDHIIPVSKGGGNEPENLRTSCAACNAGKSNKPIGATANNQDSKRRAQEALEAVDTAKAFAKASKARDDLRARVGAFACSCLNTESCMKSTITSLVSALDYQPIETVMKWFEAAVRKTTVGDWTHEENAMKYFHGTIRRAREQAASRV